MYKIVVDAMGGDNGSKVIIEAINNFLKNHQDVEVIVVGNEVELAPLKNTCRIVHAPGVVPMTAGALEVMHMKDASMNVALKLYKEENCNAVISCGSTGGFLSAATIILKLVPGLKRAALVNPFPTQIKGKYVTILDMGANNENSPEELLQFAKMGRLYVQSVYNIKEPKVYLLSNGSEDHKGCPEVKAANKLLRETNFPNFCGNIEARYVLTGEADVIVCDGYSGNILLKGIEGTAKWMAGFIKTMFKKNLWSKIGYLHVRKDMKNFQETMDYKSVGGAMLLGVNGIVVKAHGNSDAYAFESAMKVAYKMAKADIVKNMQEGMK